VLVTKSEELSAAYDYTDASYSALMAFEREFRLVYVRQGGEAPGQVGSFTLHYRRRP
jgi:hypothetical protein